MGRLWGCFFMAALLCATLSGCAEVRFISDYDDVTDQSLTAMQREVETLLTALERHPQAPACVYATHADTYARITVDLNLLIARNSVRPDNDLTLRQLLLLRDSVETFEQLHQLGGDTSCLTAADIAPLRGAFDSSFTAILKLELAKRRGLKDGK